MLRRLASKHVRYFGYKSKNYSLVAGKPGDKVFSFNANNIGIAPQGLLNNFWNYNNIYYKKQELIESYPQLCDEIVSLNNITLKEKNIWLHRYHKFTKMDKDKISDLVKVHTSNNTGLMANFFGFIAVFSGLMDLGILFKIATIPSFYDLYYLCGFSGVMIPAILATVYTTPKYLDNCDMIYDHVYISAIKDNKFDKECDDLGYMFEQAINRIENNDKYIELANKEKELSDMSEYEIEQMLKKHIQNSQ